MHNHRTLLTCTMLLLLVAPASAEDHPTSVRVTSSNRTCSGTLIAKDATGQVLGLGAAHCFSKRKPLTVHLSDGTKAKAHILKHEEGVDLMLFSFKPTPKQLTNIKVAPLARSLKADGEFYAVGFPGGQKNPAKVQLKLDSKGGPKSWTWFAVKGGRFSWGSSGGGVFTEDGKLVGAIARCNGAEFTKLGTSTLEDVRHFVAYSPAMAVANVRPDNVYPDAVASEKIRQLQQQVAELYKLVAALEARRPPAPVIGPTGPAGATGATVAGPAGPAGPQGQPGGPGPTGVIRVEVYRQGRLDKTVTDVRTGSTVRLNISDK